MSSTPGPGAPMSGAAFAEGMRSLRGRLDAARVDGAHTDDELVAGLETAYEELRVAEEELRAQQAQIDGLLDDRRMLRWEHERMLAVLPVPVLSTDEAGIVRTANPAAGQLFGMRIARLLGKPVMAFFDPVDRAAIRRHLSAHQRERDAGFRVGATLRGLPRPPRSDGSESDPESVEVTVSPTVGLADGLTWLILRRPVDGRTEGDPALPVALTRLAALSSYGGSLQELLGQVLTAAGPVFGDHIEVSVTVGPPEQPMAISTTSVLAQQMDGAQVIAGEGPCVSAFAEATTIVTADVRLDDRWPALSRHVPAGLGAAVGVPLEVGEELVGALNLYRRGTGWPAGSVESAELVAATIASVLYERGVREELAALAADMGRALDSRAVIDQAKGIVMGDKGIDADAAFVYLAEISSRTGVKVRDVARLMVEQASDGRRPS